VNNDALIGYTGFVGGHLRRQCPFGRMFNSKNIHEMRGRHFPLLVCAGVSAVKWLANLEPEKDLAGIQSLLEVLETVTADEAVLISTVDVFAEPVGVDEDGDPYAGRNLPPYGRHRLMVESFFRARFPTLVVRLPGLFGAGLKKNVIFDFIHGNNVRQINSHSVYQFYNLDNLHSDIMRSREAGLSLVHLATAPVSVRAVAQAAFGLDFTNGNEQNAARYDMQTKHAGLWGRKRYLNTRKESLREIKDFVERERAGATLA
jgi:nucleoside-diphosphate-sugar epimerase